MRTYDNLKYKNYEILVVCDKRVALPKLKSRVRFILTGEKQTGPAEKRDLAIQKYAKGEICAFIDDDAYPDPDWLQSAAKNFTDPQIVATGGPGLTPPDDQFWQRISGHILASYFGSGGIQGRYYPVNRRFFVREHPAYNLFIRTNTLKKVGNYGTTFYGGEDMVVCLKILKHGKILYDPSIVVYHHRRKFPFGHLKQYNAVGLKRGYMYRRYTEISRYKVFLLPTMLTTGFMVGLIFSFFDKTVFYIFFSTFMLLWMAATISVLKHKADLISSIIAGLGIIFTHLGYGLNFVKGYFTDHLDR